MKTTTSEIPAQQPVLGLSLESIYLNHVLQTLGRVQTAFESNKPQVFDLYIAYLRHSVLDDATCTRIDEQVRQLRERMQRSGRDNESIHYDEGFIVIREVFRYLNTSFDLGHEDILGTIGDQDMIQL